MSDLLAHIESYLQATGMSPTAFGKDALGDPGFVRQLRKGRRVWPETQTRALKYIEDHPVVSGQSAEAAE